MNKLAAFLIISVLIVGVVLVNRSTKLQSPNPESFVFSTPTPKPSPSNAFGYKFNDGAFGVSWFEADPKSLALIPNYSEKKTSGQIKQANGCRSLVNGGFYSKNGSAIGLVVTDNKIINKFQENFLFNGIFSINERGIPKISYEVPERPKLAIQSGPVLIFNGQMLTINSNDEESARRTVVAVTADGKLIFLSFYRSDSVYEGPLLKDLPAHLQSYEDLSKEKIAYALNLDGGSASAFVTEEINLGELTSVGSFFCEK